MPIHGSGLVLAPWVTMSMPQNFRIFSLILLLLGSGAATAQIYWEPLLRRELLCGPLPYERVDCFSSHGRGITNEDRGNYSGHDAANWNILCDYQGPGVLTEFGWSRRNPVETLRFRVFVDDTVTYDLDVRADSLCGRTSPFLPPLADSTTGWSWNYAPVPFQQSLRITYAGNAIAYHGCVTLYNDTASFESFRAPVPLSYFLKRDTMATIWSHPSQPAMATRPAASFAIDSTLEVYADREMFRYDGSGVVRKFWMIPQDTTRSHLDRTVIRFFVDHAPEAAIDVPIGLLFGCSYGSVEYTSAITGRVGDTLYFNAPMPFTTQLRVEIQNNVVTPNTNRIQMGADIVAMTGANVPKYRLGGKQFRQAPTARYQPFRAADFHGKGNFLGLMLEIENTTGAVLEGDESLYADGQLVREGIGTPEYFNGSYNWLAPNGVPAYSRLYAHGVVRITNNDYVCYRYHMSDAVPFSDSLQLDLEVGAWGHLSGNYRSFALAYFDPPACSVRDQDSSHTSLGGEVLSIFCRGLANGRVLQRVTWNGIPLEYASGVMVAADSVINVKVRAPFTQPGIAPLVAEFADGSVVVDPAWKHETDPQISFRVLNTDPNGYVFSGDSLELELHGYPLDETATVLFMGHELSWIGGYPAANSNGVIQGLVKMPQAPVDMPEGFAPLTAQARTTEGIPDAVSDDMLGAFRVLRFEIETLPVLESQHGTIREYCATDYQLFDNLDPWGRMVVKKMVCDTAGAAFVTFGFEVPVAGNYRLSYFLGKSETSGFVRILVDDTVEADSLQMYDPIIFPEGYWERTDTIRGNWHYFDAGSHTVTFAGHRATVLQSTFDMIFDQVLFESEFHQGIPFAAEQRPELPTTAALLPPYPNPFNGSARLKFRLTQSSDVRLDIFNLLGQRVTTLVNERMETGEYVREFNCPECASGLYLARLSLPNTTVTQKMLLLK